MSLPIRRLVVIAGVALGLPAAGCGSPSSNPGAILAAPTVPSTPVEASRAPGIKGTVLTDSKAARLDASAATPGLRVSLVGTPLSTTTDSHGHFTLANAPVGSGTLRFEGQGVDAKLGVTLHQGKELHISVKVQGGNADLECAQEIEEPEGDNNDGQQNDGQHETEGQPNPGDINVCDQGDQEQ